MKRKVLFVIESLAGGGAEKVLSVLIKHFDYNKYEVTVCPIVNEGIYCEDVRKQVTHYKPIISYKGSSLSRLWNRIKYKLVYSYLPLSWVYKWFVPQGHDVEIAFCEGFLTKLLSHANSKAKKIAWVHTDLKDNPWPIKSGIYQDLEEERNAYRNFHRIVCVSQSAHQSFCDLYGFEDKTITICNPIDVNDIWSKVGHKKCEEGTVRLISVGRLVPQKGYDRLLKVVKRLHDNGYLVDLLILGEGSERETLEKYVESHDMQSYVALPGFSENPYQEMSESDLFVCSSRAEGFSLVIAEAMVLGIPVVSTYCSGPNELLQEGKFGMLVENSEEGLYAGLVNALNNMEIMRDYAKVARGRMRDLIPSQVVNKIESLMDD